MDFKQRFYSLYETYITRPGSEELRQWLEASTFDTDPFGYHGPASVFLIQRHMKLTDEEVAAIACHMGACDRPTTDYSLQDVYQKYPLAYALHVADCLASFYDEKTV